MNQVKGFFQTVGVVLLIFLLILVLGHFVIKGAMILKRTVAGIPINDLSTFDNSVDRKLYPWYYWRRDDRESENVNIVNGIRKTIKNPDNNAKKVFMLGGSTTFGTGVDDQNTIPSLLQKKLGNKFDVYNFGESAYISVQETNYLLEKLSEGDIPDVVIFYDGFNDGYASLYSPGFPREPGYIRASLNESNRIQNLSFLDSIFGIIKRTHWGSLLNYIVYGQSVVPQSKPFSKEWDKTIDNKNVSKNIKKTLDYWLHNVRQIRAIGKEYGFKTYFFWQPNALSGSKKLNQQEKIIVDSNSVTKKAHTIFEDLYLASSKKLKSKESLGVYFMGDIFKDELETLYIDYVHLNKYGNKLIANKIFEVIGNE